MKTNRTAQAGYDHKFERRLKMKTITEYIASFPELAGYDGDFIEVPEFELSGEFRISIRTSDFSVTVRYNGASITRDDPRLTKGDWEYLNYAIPRMIAQTEKEIKELAADNPLAPPPVD